MAARKEIFEVMERMKMIVRATSMGDVHTMALYPAIASHRDLGSEAATAAGDRR